MSSDGKVVYEVRGDYSKLDSDLQQSQEKVKKSSLSVEKLLTTSAKAIGAAFATSLAAGSAAIVAFGKKGVDLASDLEEVQNVVDTTFGEKGAAQIEEFAKAAIEGFGLSELSAKQMSSTMGAMLKSMGLADEEVLKMSQSMTGLAGDMASFYNLDPTEAFDKLRAGISGETEPLKQLGINMSVVNLEAYAMAQGITTAYKDMTEAEKATLRYQYIMQTTADAQGDFAKTSDSYANQTRILGEEFNSLAGEMGQILLPAMTSGIKVLRESTVGNEEFRNALRGVFEIVAQLAEKAVPVLVEVFQKVSERAKELSGAVIPVLTTVFQALAPWVDTIIKYVKNLIEVFIEIVKPIMNAVKEAFNPLMEAIGELYKVVFPKLQSAMDALKPYFTTWGKGVGDIFGNAIKTVTAVFTELINFVKNVFTGNWRSAWQNVVNIFSSLWNGIKSAFKIPINSLIDMLNQFTSGLSKIKIPDWVPGVGGKGFSLPKIPRLRVGMDFVPSDDFPALLHRGEAVLTAAEAARWRAGYSMPGGMAAAGGMSIDYERLGAAVAKNIAGMAVKMDGETVGSLVEGRVSAQQARRVESMHRSGFNGKI